MNKAIFIKDFKTHFGNAKLYKMNPAYEGHDFVRASAANVPYSGDEVYLFPSDEKGNISDFGELDGSYRGGLDFSKVIKDIGYEERYVSKIEICLIILFYKIKRFLNPLFQVVVRRIIQERRGELNDTQYRGLN
jgi:hypothetical protein